MTPWEIAKPESESAHQKALFAWAAIAERRGFEAAWNPESYKTPPDVTAWPVPELCWLHAIPNGGARNAITAGRMKAEGVKKGVPDIFLPLPVANSPTREFIVLAGLYIEMKKPTKGRTSEKQNEFITYANNIGYKAVVCRSWEDAAKAIQKYIYVARV